ncbi:MAG: APC family permease [Acidobacteriia bacterium]|nr:APC family permease [Terriglobia bacterium]
MCNMVGVGPFITIPLILASMGGPQCMLGWLLGAVLALSDGLVWSELAAAMPGSGGTYLYLRTAFRDTRWGALLPFLFIWQFIFSAPLEIASGYIGFSQYLSYFWRSMSPWHMKFTAAAVGVVVMVLLYRRISAIGRMTVVLWVGMLLTVGSIIVSGMAHFNASLAFDFSRNAFSFTRGFFLGLGGATLLSMYCFLGYYDICFVGGEVRRPERVIPRAILFSVIGVALIYVVMNLAIVGVVPWREAMQSRYVAARFMEQLHWPRAAAALTVMILWTAFASVFALLLGYSRVPYAAALDGYFFKAFGKLHPGGFPSLSLLVIGGLAVGASFFKLDWVISALITARILAQFIAQIAALHHIRRKRADIARPFRMWLYPLPSLVALAGWCYIFLTSGWTYALFGLGVLATGVAAFAVWRRQALHRM